MVCKFTHKIYMEKLVRETAWNYDQVMFIRKFEFVYIYSTIIDLKVTRIILVGSIKYGLRCFSVCIIILLIRTFLTSSSNNSAFALII